MPNRCFFGSGLLKMGSFCIVCGSKYLFACLWSIARETQLWARIWELWPTIEPKNAVFLDDLFTTKSILRSICPTYEFKTRHFVLYWPTSNYNYGILEGNSGGILIHSFPSFLYYSFLSYWDHSRRESWEWRIDDRDDMKRLVMQKIHVEIRYVRSSGQEIQGIMGWYIVSGWWKYLDTKDE